MSKKSDTLLLCPALPSLQVYTLIACHTSFCLIGKNMFLCVNIFFVSWELWDRVGDSCPMTVVTLNCWDLGSSIHHFKKALGILNSDPGQRYSLLAKTGRLIKSFHGHHNPSKHWLLWKDSGLVLWRQELYRPNMSFFTKFLRGTFWARSWPHEAFWHQQVSIFYVWVKMACSSIAAHSMTFNNAFLFFWKYSLEDSDAYIVVYNVHGVNG